eukprot:COSAG02_NODE_1026_length_15134_cov_382.979714_19_plen_301_part_00
MHDELSRARARAHAWSGSVRGGPGPNTRQQSCVDPARRHTQMVLLRASAAGALLLLLAPAPGAPLKYIVEWCHIGCDNITQTSHSWANLAMPKHGNAKTTDAFWRQWKTPSLMPMPEAAVFTRNVGLVSGWESVLEKFAAEEVLPRLANRTAIGVFLGDEICCRNSSCWHDMLYPLSAKLRSLLGRDAILYENECGISALFDKLDKIPPDLDWFSVDGYWGYDPAHAGGATEVRFMKAFAEKEMYPRMSSSQQLVVVPGTFACSNFSYMPLANSSRSVVAKLRAYLDWAKADPKVGGRSI